MATTVLRLLLLTLLLPLRAGAEGPRVIEAGPLKLRIPERWRERRVAKKATLRYTQFALRDTPTKGENVAFFAEIPPMDKRFVGPPPGDFAVLHYGRGGKGQPGRVLRDWIAQFAPKGREIDDGEVVSRDPQVWIREGKREGGAYTLVDIRGTYYYNLAGWWRVEVELVPEVRMLCAIIPAEDGPRYVKFTGREALVDPAEEEFRAALGLDASSEVPLDRDLRRIVPAVRVRFVLDGKPHAAAGIRVSLGDEEAACSADGATFDAAKPGKHRLRVGPVEGFNPVPEREIEIEGGKTTEVVLALDARA